jgi:predicted HTH transcriptional regulator
MTNFDFLKAVAEGNITDDVKAYAKEKYDKEAETRNAKKAEDEAIKNAILEALKGKEHLTASELGEIAGTSTSKASYVCRTLVDNNELKSKDVLGKSGKVKGYYLP